MKTSQNSVREGRLQAAQTANDKPIDDQDETTCPRCGESQQLAKVKGCVKCLACGFKFDCNGW